MPLPIQIVAGRCDACLGNRQCWICLGQGRVERADGGFSSCSRCAGTGRCSYCATEHADGGFSAGAPTSGAPGTGAPEAGPPLPGPVQPDHRVIRLDEPRQSSFF